MAEPYDTEVNHSPIKTPRAPAAIGPYSQAMLASDTLYCSGQIGLDPETGSLCNESLEAETERVLDNLEAILKAADLSFHHVVRCTVYLTDISDYAQVNEIYARYFKSSMPAREAVQVAALPREARVEISCVAVR